MISFVLSKLFPPQLGKIDVDSLMLLQKIRDGQIAVVKSEEFDGVVRVFEYVEGSTAYEPRRVR